MLGLLTTLGVAEGEGASSHVAFYLLGCALAAWAVLVGVMGVLRPAFASSQGASRAVMGLTALLVVGACASAVITA